MCVTSDLSSRKWTMSSPKETSAAGHGWNLYVVDTVSPLTLYQEMVTHTQAFYLLFLILTCTIINDGQEIKPEGKTKFTYHVQCVNV